ncbi:MAG: hypothetical protein KBT02_08510 [Treponema sp.]|nr:hypothetical protein [Candidatus Treponema caballi]
MFFDIIITLTVSLGAILAFRQIDKKDKSLELIRDFTNKVRGEFDVYFQKNAKDMQNCVNDLETAQSTAVAAIKRLDAITSDVEAKEAAYKERAANLDEISAQIDKFNTMLNDLVEMAQNTEENLLRIQKESRFLDKTTKKIETQKDMLESIEARIPTLLADFEKTDAEKLEACTADLKSHIQEQSQFLAETAEEAVKKNNTLLEEVRKTCEEALALASDKAGSLENDAFQKMAAAAEERLNRYNAEITASIEAFSKSAGEQLAASRNEAASGLESSRQEAMEHIEAIRKDVEESICSIRLDVDEGIGAIREQTADGTASLKAEIESACSKVHADAQALLASFKSETESAVSAMHDDTTAKLSEIRSDSEKGIASVREETEAGIEAFKTAAGNTIAKLRKEAAASIAAVKEETEAAVAAVRSGSESAVAAVKNDTEAAVAAVKEGSAADIAAVREETAADVASVRKETSADIAAVKDQVASEITSVSNELEESLNAHRTELTSSLNTRLTSEISRVEADTAACLASIQGSVTEKVKALETETAELTNVLDARFKKKTADMESELTADFTARNAELLEKLSSQSRQLADELESQKTMLEKTISDFQNQLAVDFSSKREELERQLAEHEEAFNEKLTAAESSVASFKQSFDSESSSVLDYARNELKRMSDEQQSRLDALEQGRTSFDEEFAALKSRLEADNASLKEKLETESSSVAEQAASVNAALTGQIASMRDTLSEQVTQFREKLEGALSADSAQYADKQQKFFTEIENQLEQCKSDVLYRFERLNTSTEEIDGLENALREAMAAARQRVDSDFARFTQGQNERQATFESDIASRNDALSTRLHGLEGELNDLKEKAYGSVSEKLKLFEDQFFSDLSKRSGAMEESMLQWQRDVNGKLSEISNQYEDSRRATEEKYGEQMKIELSGVQDRLKEQTARLEDLIKNSEKTLQERINNTEYGFRAFIEQQRVELENAKNSASEYLKNELTSYNTQADEILKRYERDINAQLEQIAQNVGASQEKADSQVQAVLTDFSTWRDRMNAQFEDTKSLFSEKLGSLDQNASDLISQVQQSFTTDLADFNRKIAEDQNTMTVRLDDVKKDMQAAFSDYEIRSKGVIEDLQRNYDEMLSQVQHNINETNIDSEQKLRALKDMVQDIRTRTDDVQDKLLGKIQADANALNLSLDAVDKRLKEYMAQTQIIDKVEEHKVKLEDQLTSLRAEITKFDNFKQTAADVDQQINKIRKAEEAISMNAQKFTAEKKRMDLMEADFNKLMSLSSTMDQKITELQNSHDDLQLIQADIRKFQDALSDITGQYDRLDKKAPVLEQTINDVDKSFETLKNLEKHLSTCYEQTSQFPEKIGELQGNVSRLLEAGPKIGDAVKKLSSLDAIIKNAENHIADLTSKNEWLARTEGRLQEISKGADSQLQLLKSITSRADNADVSPAGAPPIAVRENVITLAHKGWSATQISNALKLSQSEVELILDYYGKDEK